MSSKSDAITRGPAPRVRTARLADRLVTLNIASVLAGIVAWWLVATLDPEGVPGPQAVVERGAQLIANGSIFVDIGASLRRVFLGFAIGTLLAVPIGFLMGWYGWVRGLLEPYIQFFRTIPPLAIIPIAIVFLGIGEVPKVFVIALAAFLVSVISTFQGVITVDKVLINAARVLGANDFTVFRRVIVPASTPFILVGMRVGLGAAWSTLVASELIAAQEGLGHRMQQAQVYYDLPTIFVGLVLIGVLGMVMDRAILWADKRLTTWQERR
jgi:NitT/TauT family transport system permease protein